MVPQDVDELIEKQGNPELEFRWRRRRNRPQLRLGPAAADQLFAVLGDKVMKHDRHTFLTFSRRRTDSTTKKPHEQEQPRFDLGVRSLRVENLTANGTGSSRAERLATVRRPTAELAVSF